MIVDHHYQLLLVAVTKVWQDGGVPQLTDPRLVLIQRLSMCTVHVKAILQELKITTNWYSIKGNIGPSFIFIPFAPIISVRISHGTIFSFLFCYCDQVIKLVDPASESIQFIIHFYQSFFSRECHITETKPWAWKKSGWNSLIIVCRCKRAKIKWEKITLYTWVSLLQKMVKRLKKKLFTGFYCSI